MKILALDTSSITATVALLDGEKVLGEYTLNQKKTHSQRIMPMIEELLTSLELAPKDIDAFAVSLGPGSFTGLRIGIATITAMAHALDKVIVGVPTLEALAYNLYNSRGLVCPIIDAQRDLVYAALYKWEDGEMIELMEGDIIKVDDLLSKLEKEDDKIFFVGDGLERFSDTLKAGLGERFVLPPTKLRIPSAASVGEVAKLKIQKDIVYDILPIYMRRSEAEVEFEKRMMDQDAK